MRKILPFCLVFIFVLGCQTKKEGVSKEAGEKVQISSPPLELKAPESLTDKAISTDITISPLPLEEKPLAETKPLKIPQIAQLIPYQPKIVEAGLAVEMIIDASGSMNGILGADTKINIAKTIIEDLASQWAMLKEPPIHLALRVFGSEQSLETHQCDDTKLLFPPANIDLASLKKSLEEIQAKGESSTAFSLRKAAEDLSKQNEDLVIILVTDGKDTCEQDPCAVAKELYDGQFKIMTHVVAFDVAQADEAALKCIAEASKGVFLLARTREELASALDEALRSTVPYNLRLKVLVGGTPLPTTITIYKAGTQEVLQREESYGIELLRLSPSAYDILVEYSQSIEETKPSKILKGVELTEQGKIEQEIRFDLASVTLSAHDAKGEKTETQYTFYKAGTEEKVAGFVGTGEETTLFMASGNYDLVAHKKAPEGGEMTLMEPNIQVSSEQGFVKHFAFQIGTLILKGQMPDKKPVGLLYQVTRPNQPESVITKGQIEANGGKIELAPGTYDIKVEGQDPALSLQPIGEIKGLTMEGGSIQEQTITLIVGTLNLQAFKAEKQLAPTEFKIIDPKDSREIAKLKAEEGKASIGLPPGKYDIQASLISTLYTKAPIVEAKGVTIEEGKIVDQNLQYELGGLKLLGRNAKEQKIKTIFYIYSGGTEEVVATAADQEGWVQFDLNPGNYDVKGVDSQAALDPKPFVWIRDITVEAGSLYVREAVFTNAKVKLIGRGANNEIVPVEFKLYEYGHDRALLIGVTGQDWQSFDLNPGKYYIEASFHDPQSSQTLKKWINLKVAENEFVEQELRF